MNVGEAIRKQRTDHNFTQQHLADRLLISRTTISSWENGRTYPDLSMLITLSDVFGISVDSLLRGDENMVGTIDKNVKKGKRLKYYLIILIIVVAIIGSYLLILQSKKNKLHNSIKDWNEVGDYYSLSEGDMNYMTTYSNTIDIRDIPNQLNLIVNRSNDDNSEITMMYDGDDSNIEVSFISGPIEGISIVFDNDKFTLNQDSNDSRNIKYSYEIRKSVNSQLEKDQEYLQDTFRKVKNKWKTINGI